MIGLVGWWVSGLGAGRGKASATITRHVTDVRGLLRGVGAGAADAVQVCQAPSGDRLPDGRQPHDGVPGLCAMRACRRGDRGRVGLFSGRMGTDHQRPSHPPGGSTRRRWRASSCPRAWGGTGSLGRARGEGATDDKAGAQNTTHTHTRRPTYRAMRSRRVPQMVQSTRFMNPVMRIWSPPPAVWWMFDETGLGSVSSRLHAQEEDASRSAPPIDLPRLKRASKPWPWQALPPAAAAPPCAVWCAHEGGRGGSVGV